jgi:hypothetical protein
LNIVHFRDTNVNIVQINPEATTMQTVISEITFTFIDDAIALAAGFKRITVGLATDAMTALVRKLTAPIDRLARACDVAGTLSARDAETPAADTRSRPRRGRGVFDILGLLSIFRALRNLT